MGAKVELLLLTLITAVAQSTSTDVPLKLTSNQGFFLEDIDNEFYFAESYYRVRYLFNRDSWTETFGDGILILLGAKWDDHTEEIYQSSYQRVLEDCGKGRLPHSAVPDEKIREILLEDVEPKLEAKNLEFTFPPTGKERSDLFTYRNHNLTMCRISKDSVEITVKVPVKRKGYQFQLKRIQRIEFLVGPHNLCQLWEDEDAKYILFRNQEKFLVTSAAEFQCDDQKHGRGWIKDLCFIRKSTQPNLSPCLESIISERPLEEIHRNCRKFACREGTHSLAKVGNSIFVTNLDANVTCNNPGGAGKYQRIIPPPPLGALQIDLCSCEFYFNQESMKNSEPCSQVLGKSDDSILNIFPTSMVVAGLNISSDVLSQQLLKPSLTVDDGRIEL